MATTPTRFDSELFESARIAGTRFTRSAAQQLAHWARIGRAFEAAPIIDQRIVADVLAGRTAYDNVNPLTQAIIRGAWDEGIEAKLNSLNLAESFTRLNRGWVEADSAGVATIVPSVNSAP